MRVDVVLFVALLVAPQGARAAQHDPLLWPSISFGAQDTLLAEDAVALTFDDGPRTVDGTNGTEQVLDILRDHGVNATFFLCGNTSEDMRSDAKINSIVQRIAREGHTIGNHSYTHRRAHDLPTSAIDQDFARNEQFVKAALGEPYGMALYRMPYGMPFYGEDDDARRVAPVLRSYGVHVGWGIDSGDWKCNGDDHPVDCIVTATERALRSGQRGPLLMHSLHRGSAEALPQILAMLRDASIRIVSVEDMIFARYGMHAAAIRALAIGMSPSDDDVGRFAMQECRQHPPSPVFY